MFDWKRKSDERKAQEEIAMLEAAGCASMADELRVYWGFPPMKRDRKSAASDHKKSYMMP
ncbi:MAG: hypothetical protein LBS93_00290 [Synergistaceae bacterium]|jgi:hypothetical protein|nr:hypothetical protein [Synergistaceae bacterium]